jgi:hypothetical protein
MLARIYIFAGPGDGTHNTTWVAMLTMPGDGTHTTMWTTMMTIPGDGTHNTVAGTHKEVANKAETGDGTHTAAANKATTHNRTHNEATNDVAVASPQESDTWMGREDTIRAQGLTSYAVLTLNISRGTAAPLGINTSSIIVLSPPVQIYSRAATITCYGGARSRVIGNVGSNDVIDVSNHDVVHNNIHCKGLTKDPSSPFAAVVSGCTCTGCIDLKSGVIYKIKCYNRVCPFKLTPKCLSIHQYTLSCQEFCGASMCPKCHGRGLLVDVHQKCTMYG